jgi:hypothetical protein
MLGHKTWMAGTSPAMTAQRKLGPDEAAGISVSLARSFRLKTAAVANTIGAKHARARMEDAHVPQKLLVRRRL